MATIELGDDLAYSFIGALLSIARIDGEISINESKVLREVADEISGSDDFDFEFALTQALPVTKFAAQLRESGDGPFRGGGANVSPEQVAKAFVDAAERVASADEGPQVGEERMIREFKSRFGFAPGE